MPLTQHVRIGAPVIGGTNQSVLFVDSNGQLQQSAGLTWDDTNRALTISRAGAASLKLVDTGSSSFPWAFTTNNAAGALRFEREGLSQPSFLDFVFYNPSITSGLGSLEITAVDIRGMSAGVDPLLAFKMTSGTMVFCSSDGGGARAIQFGRRYTDSSSGVGVTAEFWPTSSQTIPVICTVEPGAGSYPDHAPVYRWGVMPNGDVQHYVTTSKIYWTGRAEILSPADGRLILRDTAGTSFDRLQFGGTTSSYPALKRSSAVLQVKLADDSAFAQLDALQVALVDGVTAPSATGGLAKIFVDTADGELKVIFGDGETRIITGTPVDYLAVLAGI